MLRFKPVVQNFHANSLRERERGKFALCAIVNMDQAPLPFVLDSPMGSGPNWYQIVSKTCYIPKANKFYLEKEYLC